MIRMITAGDRRLMRSVNRWRPPRWLRAWMIASSRAGDGWLWLVIGSMVLCFGGPARMTVVLTGLASAGLGWAVFYEVKQLIGRERPCVIEPHCWATLLPPDRFSFPSGHSIMAFSIAVSVGLFYRPVLPILIFCAMSVAASRIMLGLHYVTDVLAGIALGIAIGILAFELIPAVIQLTPLRALASL